MDGEPKKISFGFSKLMKKPLSKPVEEKKQFIDCLEGKSIKVIGGEILEEKKVLVIPLKDKSTTSSALARIARGEVDTTENVDQDIADEPPTEPVANETLDQRAEREIMEDLKKKTAKLNSISNLVVPVADNIKLTGEKESTLEDYENIPVGDFGMAMLRGMGWQPGKGMGKHCKSSELVLPNLRPKGMGLGADKVTSVQKSDKPTAVNDDLKIVKGAYVQIIAGKQSGAYGQISGFDEDSARLIVKAAIGGANINLSEFMVKAITKDEYQKMSKVINSVKYEEYKNKESQNSGILEKHKKQSSNSRTNYEDEDRSRGQELPNREDDDHSERNHRDKYKNQISSKNYSDNKSSSSKQSSHHSDRGSRRDHRNSSSSSSPEPRRDIDKKRKGKKKRRDRSRSRERRRH